MPDINYYLQESLISIIVVFNCQKNLLSKTLKLHKNSFSRTILVNNSPEILLDSLKSSQVTIINNDSNTGLSSALNVGILEAKKQGA